ncbi:Vacuolar protein sorting-associated protein 9b [Colletotrichum chlorophyti]|uniref:Vacuolar protein sorting-associated protein 9b n=1 Tax=Colletotrichum chlorophyti TaxID=708187 RepID=A0A1Q8RN97_9PEZI|nr:Vacuolar protein sorting-associated protein 9b [Colletotrichum chlorophyti]
MASTGPSKVPAARPNTIRTPSFTRQSEDSDPLRVPKRAQTFQNGTIPDPMATRPVVPSKATPVDEPEAPDAFETRPSTDNDDSYDGRGSVDLGELPIELVSLTDSFVETLTTKTHPTPLTIENVSSLFQDFYQVASTHVNTHISALVSRHNRDTSPAPSASSRVSTASRLRAKAASLGSKDKPKVLPKAEPEQQMITAEELANKKKARKAIEAKRSIIEEAVERRLCEGIYHKIYRHKSTQDEAQDAKLRSKTAALALVGIGPADLGIDLGEEASQTPEAASEKVEEIKKALEQARRDLILMNEKRYPLGKLHHLKAAHKSIVETLAQFHPSASADEIMPMLIFTLITLPPEHLNVISDLHFIQHFRWEPKLTGEAAYCLTNLEAAISFLETVDLSTLRADELPQGPARGPSLPGTPRADTFPPAFPPGLTVTPDSPVETNTNNATPTRPPPSPSASAGLRAAVQARNRRLSELVNTPAQAIGAASDAVLNTADQHLKTISTSLGDSYKFLVGKLRETQGTPTESGQGLVVPKTLDDARKLVSTPPPEEEGSVSGASSVHGAEEAEITRRPPVREDKVLNLIGGRKVSRDHSADSAGSSKKVLFAKDGEKDALPTPSPASTNNPLDSVRNFGNSFSRFSGMSMIRGLSRTASTPVVASKDAPKDMPVKEAVAKAPVADGGDLASAFPDIAAALPPKQVPKVSPPNKRFMELQNPGDLKLGEVLDLLRDYRRLANALKDMGAFEGSK